MLVVEAGPVEAPVMTVLVGLLLLAAHLTSVLLIGRDKGLILSFVPLLLLADLLLAATTAFCWDGCEGRGSVYDAVVMLSLYALILAFVGVVLAGPTVWLLRVVRGLWGAKAAEWLAAGMLMIVVVLIASEWRGKGDGNGDQVDLSAAKKFKEFRLYYLGESFQGLPLTVSDSTGFIYGGCEPEPQPFWAFWEEGNCPYHHEVQNWSICKRYPALYLEPPKVFNFRGAKAARVSSAESFEVYTGRTAIVTFGSTRMAKQLRPIGAKAPARRFPPPVPGALSGQLPCQKKHSADGKSSSSRGKN